MKTFIHHDIAKCTQLNLESGRVYRTPEGNEYPSVTRVLSHYGSNNKYLSEWKAAVGEDEARKISARAASRGTKLHEACENYLLNKPTVWGMFDSESKQMFTHCLPLLERINNIHAIELGMWSDKLQVAGTTDLIAEIDGVLSVQDWKSSSRYKTKDEISGYFMQGACYAYMFFERTGIAIPRIDIHISTAEFGLTTHTADVREWVPKFIQVRKDFRATYGI